MAVIPLPISFQIDEPGLAKAVLQQIADRLARALQSGYDTAVRQRVQAEASALLFRAPQYLSLTTDPGVKGEMGLVDPQGAFLGIVQGISQAMSVVIDTPRVQGLALTGGVTLGLLRADLSDVLQIPQSRFTSEKGFDVRWLEWSLGLGGTIAVGGFSFLPGASVHGRYKGRLGLGLMRKGGPGWSVPHPFGANWLAQAFAGAEAVIGQVMVDELVRRL